MESMSSPTESGSRLRTVFMGTPELAVPALQALAAATTVTCVVTQPDRGAGRGRSLRPPPVKVAAEALSLPVWQPETLRGAESAEQLQDADLFVVMAYGELLRQPVLDLPRGACINLHASLLPRWRGASPLQAVLRAGDEATGVCVMGMVKALDAGPVYLTERIPLGPEATLPWLHDEIGPVAARALSRFLDAWPELEAVPQDDALVTWCGKLTSADGELDPQLPATELARQIRAYVPMPGCWFACEGDRLRVHQVRVVDAPAGTLPGDTGVFERQPVVTCGAGALVLERLQAPGAKAMDGTAFLNGRSLPARLG
jgi:methionyl-tRNA formyltransferase